jgi:hypothetical protein
MPAHTLHPVALGFVCSYKGHAIVVTDSFIVGMIQFLR